MHIVSRSPSHPRLQGGVRTLWACQGRAAHAREILLPSGRAQIVVSLVDGAPTATLHGLRTSASVVATASQRYLCGASLEHGGSRWFVERQQPIATGELGLRHLWGTRAVARLQRQLRGGRDLHVVLDRFEEELARLVDPMAGSRHFVEVCGRLLTGAAVGAVAQEQAVTPRRLIELVRHETGLTPKQFARLGRFANLVSAVRARPDWAGLAYTLGFADQSHMNREFKAFSGMTPGQYVRRVGASPNHVPLIDA